MLQNQENKLIFRNYIMLDLKKLYKVLSNYDLHGELFKTELYGFGRTNKTILIGTINSGEHNYILQKINSNLFKNVDALMNNIELITNHIKNKYTEKGKDYKNKVLNIIKTKKNKNYVKIGKEYYRIYDFIEDSICIQQVTRSKQIYELGRAFGKFQQQLSDFDSSKLYITIPNFHNTLSRYQDFLQILNANKLDRTKGIEDLIEFVKQKSFRYTSILVDKEKNGDLPIRVVHNDTKINNVVFDELGKAKAILDLDTVMPNTLCYDFGDAIRFACNTAGEEETNLDKVGFNKDYFDKFCEGYFSKTSEMLTDKEWDILFISPLVLAFELGVRFLGDFLNGDKYFGVSSPLDNLNRAKVQFKLLEELERNEKFIKHTIEKYKKSYLKTKK